MKYGNLITWEKYYCGFKPQIIDWLVLKMCYDYNISLLFIKKKVFQSNVHIQTVNYNINLKYRFQKTSYLIVCILTNTTQPYFRYKCSPYCSKMLELTKVMFLCHNEGSALAWPTDEPTFTRRHTHMPAKSTHTDTHTQTQHESDQ